MTTASLGPDPYGSTPIDAGDLIPQWVTNRRDLNELEQDTILKARAWAFGRHGRRPVADAHSLLTERFCDELQRRMFEGIWAWAGRRLAATNIGVPPWQIQGEYRKALGDAIFWHDHATFTSHELAVRIHHRIVSVHPYPNGNGRHSRLVADLYLDIIGVPPLTWGGGDLGTSGTVRERYITAIEQATSVDVSALLAFATSP